jgi:hypothetical protein
LVRQGQGLAVGYIVVKAQQVRQGLLRLPLLLQVVVLILLLLLPF